MSLQLYFENLNKLCLSVSLIKSSYKRSRKDYDYRFTVLDLKFDRMGDRMGILIYLFNFMFAVSWGDRI